MWSAIGVTGMGGGGQNRPWVWGTLRRSQEGEDWFEQSLIYYFPFHHSLPIFFWPLFKSVAPPKNTILR